jgi:serine/threonine-protein kinase
VTDVGIARAISEGDSRLTATGIAIGTPTYMSPEQACGEPADARSDIYSLGAVMYEMLTGQKPFQSRDTDKLLQMIALKTPPAPHEVNPEVPEALSQIVMKAMQKRPEKRYQHAHEMANDIKRFLVKGRRPQTQVSTGESEEGDNASSSSGGRRWLLAAGLLLLAGAAAVLAQRFMH